MLFIVAEHDNYTNKTKKSKMNFIDSYYNLY